MTPYQVGSRLHESVPIATCLLSRSPVHSAQTYPFGCFYGPHRCKPSKPFAKHEQVCACAIQLQYSMDRRGAAADKPKMRLIKASLET